MHPKDRNKLEQLSRKKSSAIIEEKQSRKVEDYSDEEIEEYLREQGYILETPNIISWLCDLTAITEIVRRYNNKKKECDQYLEEAKEFNSRISFLD